MTGSAAWRAASSSAAATPAVRAAVAVWLGVIVGDRLHVGFASLFAIALLLVFAVSPAAWRTRYALPAVVLGAGLIAGAAAAERAIDEAVVEPGPVRLTGHVIADSIVADEGTHLVVAVRGGEVPLPAGTKLDVVTADTVDVAVGSTVDVSGRLRTTPGWEGRHRYLGTVIGATVREIENPPFVVATGNAMRRHVLDNIVPTTPGRALLRGLLVGDTTALAPDTVAALRSTGLSHFVAVSGSNVALVVAGWWLLAGLFGLGVPGRTAGALAVVTLFAIVTRWEPSVVRASVMAACVLLARLAGYPLTAWQALGTAVTLVLLISPELAGDVGFQLSVAATVGVLVAASGGHTRAPMAVAMASSTLRITFAAQIAVLPIVLARFGEAPLLSPLANLVAAPLVTVATALGGVGALGGVPGLVTAAAVPAQGVLGVAELGASWPQLDIWSTALVGVGAAVWMVRPMRPFVAAAVVAVAVVALAPSSSVAGPTVVFLDVGQGDAILIRSGAGHDGLVDGGADPERLRSALRRHGIGALDVVVVTHGDADHAGGLRTLTDHVGVGTLIHAGLQPVGELLGLVMEEVAAAGVTVIPTLAGDRFHIGTMQVEVLSPHRRFAGENDGSVVLLLSAGARSVLLTGDIEAVAQAELPPVVPDVLQVPHHGSATTDMRWLLDTVGSVAVVSVGPNRHGHPHHDVMMALRRRGVRVLTTWEHGDVVVPLAG